MAAFYHTRLLPWTEDPGQTDGISIACTMQPASAAPRHTLRRASSQLMTSLWNYGHQSFLIRVIGRRTRYTCTPTFCIDLDCQSTLHIAEIQGYSSIETDVRTDTTNCSRPTFPSAAVGNKSIHQFAYTNYKLWFSAVLAEKTFVLYIIIIML